MGREDNRPLKNSTVRAQAFPNTVRLQFEASNSKRERRRGKCMAITSVTHQFLRRAMGVALITLLPVFFGNLAHAQTMDLGESCIQNLGYVACGGARGVVGGGGAPVVYLHFAAIALSPSRPQTGSADGRSSPDDAVNGALRNCRGNGATDCKIVASGSSCLAVAIHHPGGPYTVGTGATRAQAAANAQGIRPNLPTSSVVVAAPCGGDNVTWSAPLPLPVGLPAKTVDPNAVGTCFNNRNPGRWICTIARNGAYEFHSEAADNTPSNAGTIEIHGSSWSLEAASMKYSDKGTYSYVPPDTVNMRLSRSLDGAI